MLGTANAMGASAGASDPQRVRAAASGDVTAFESLSTAALPAAFRLASAILGDEAEAADATHVALVAAWRELPNLRDPGRFAEWFDRILLDECRMRSRQLATGAAGSSNGPGEPARAIAAPIGTYTFDREAALSVIEHAFDRLDADDRTILVLLALEQRSIDEVAGQLRMPAETVKWRLRGAREALRRAIEAT